MEIIGRQGVYVALEDDRIEKIRLVVMDRKNERIKDIIELAEKKNIKISEDRNFFNKFKRSHQGVALVIPEFQYMELDEMFKLPQEEREVVVALDSIEDVNNLGSIIRSASVFGVSKIIIPKDRAADVTPAVIKTSQGGIADVDIIKVTNLSRALKDAKSKGYFVIGCHMEGEPMENFVSPPVIIVVGNEHKGIRPGVLKECDKVHTIPMSKNSSVGSLNAGIAGSIMLYEYFKAFGV